MPSRECFPYNFHSFICEKVNFIQDELSQTLKAAAEASYLNLIKRQNLELKFKDYKWKKMSFQESKTKKQTEV